MRSPTLQLWTSVIALIATLIVLIALLNLTIQTVHAGELEDALITETAIAAIEAIDGEVDDMIAAQFTLYDITQDAEVSPQCRHYADVALVGAVILENLSYYPESNSFEFLNQLTAEVLGPAKNDCLLAI